MQIDVDVKNTLKDLDLISLTLRNKAQKILKELIISGYTVADYAFADAEYDGTNDVSLSMKFEGNTAELIASGKSVLFIEFGSGIVFTDENPKAAELGFIRGTYGKGNGANLKWVYVGEAGTNGYVIDEKKNGDTVVRTQGNPPANAMYEASKVMRDKVVSTVWEVLFGDKH